MKIQADKYTVSHNALKKAIPFFLIHILAVVLPFYYPPSWKFVLLAFASYFIRMFAITAGYHRYFSHRSFKTSRVFQFVLGFLATSSTQKGPIWWASNHRHHHTYSDKKEDIHSPVQDSFYYSHMGWILADSSDATRWYLIKDFSKYKELRFLDEHYWLPPTLFAITLFAFGGFGAVVWGYFVSTVLLWHATYTINSLCHVFGKKRYKTGDESRNNFWFAILTLGEGWHNNHHYFCTTANQGWFWWEIDMTYYILKGLSSIGIVWDLKLPPESVKYAHLASERQAPAESLKAS